MRLRRRFYPLLMLLLLSTHAFVWGQASFTDAVDLAAEQKYEEALNVWNALPSEEQSTYEWIANVAMAEEELGDLIAAKSKWLMLQKTYGPDLMIKNKLKSINRQLNVQHIDSQRFWGVTIAGKLVQPIYWLVLFSILSTISIFVVTIFRNKKSQKTIKRVLAALTILAFLIILQYAWQQRQLKRLPIYVLKVEQDWDYETESAIQWSKGLSLRVLEERGERVKVENNLGERIVIPKDDLITYNF